MGDGDKIGPSFLGLPVIVTDHQPAIGSTAGDVILGGPGEVPDRGPADDDGGAVAGVAVHERSSYFRVRTRVDGRYWVQSSTTTEAAQSCRPVVVLH